MDLISKEISELLEDSGIKKLTKIQEISLPVTIKNQNTIIVSKTGSGKTLAFILPIINKLIKKGPDSKIFALILTPTKDLSVQIYEQLIMFRKIGLRSALCIDGDCNLNDEHIIVGTPGSIRSILKNIKTVKFLVLDEADKIFSKNFEREILKILDFFGLSAQKKLKKNDHMSKEVKRKIQVILSTATYHKEQITEYLDVSKYKLAQIELSNEKILQYYAFVPFEEKIHQFFQIVSSLSKCIIFVSRIFNTFLITNFLKNMSLDACCVNGLLFQEDKNQIIQDFKDNRFNILVCTDVLARGIDIPEVENIVNYDMPSNGREYIHRIGRTARKELSGNSITIVTQYDVESLQRIEQFTGKKMEKFQYDDQITDLNVSLKAYEEALRKSKLDIKVAEEKRKNTLKKR